MKQFARFQIETREYIPKWDCTLLRCCSIGLLLLLIVSGSLLVAQEPAKSSPSSNENAQSLVVVLDPAHGGSDPGARISDRLLEKNLTLEFAKRLRQALDARGVSVKMLRDSDVALSFRQRASVANLARPAMFLSVHAEPGSVLHIFTPLPPSDKSSTESRRSFLPWQTAQSAFLQQSSALAATIAQALAKHDVEAQRLPAFVEPLAAIAAPAVAVELPCDSHGFSVDEDRVVTALTDLIVVRTDAKEGSH
ncbi:MAG TPA: N-acetylmuramoyl-L-alanine amidase [Terriglobales bacterium]|nr:N-acetylmuramoyl-L-alanine amidase [Terriglobales bacterium]